MGRRSKILGLLALATLPWPGATPAVAGEAAFTNVFLCSACSEPQKQAAATNAGDHPVVFVFDWAAGQVSRYGIEVRLIEADPYTIRKRVRPLATEPDLAGAYGNMVAAWNELAATDALSLPADAPFRTLDEVLRAPREFRTMLEALLAEGGDWFPPADHLQPLSDAWQTHGLDRAMFAPTVLDFGLGRHGVFLPVRLEDGSTLSAGLEIHFKLPEGRHFWGVGPLDNFRTSDGEPAPTRPGT